MKKKVFVGKLMFAVSAVLAVLCFRTEIGVFAAEGPTTVYYATTGVYGELGNFFKDGVYYYIAQKPSGNAIGKVYAAGCKDAATEVRIPAYVTYSSRKYAVVGINDRAFEGKNIKKVEIASGVGIISNSAFADCIGLEKVSIGDGVTEIRDYAFYGCSTLKNVKLPSSVKTVGEGCFEYCKGLTQINCPDALTEILADTFNGCESLTSFSCGKKIKIMGKYAFRGCTGLKSVKFDKALTEIAESAFMECSGLKSLKFTNNIKKVGESAFAFCSSLETVKINKKLTEIPDGCFSQCPSLKSVTISKNTTKIGRYAFNNCTSLEKVKGNNNRLKTIGDFAFGGTPKLKSFSFGSVETIGEAAFSGTGLRELNLPKTVTSIGESVFSGAHFRKIVIPGSIKEIPDLAFKDCYWLEKAFLKDGIESIGKEAFNDTYSMDAFEYPASIHYVGRDAFENSAWFEYKRGKYLSKHELTYPHFDETEQYYWNTFSYNNSANVTDYSKAPDAVCINDVCIWISSEDYYLNSLGNWTSTGKEVVTFPAGTKMVNVRFVCPDKLKKLIIPESVEILDGLYYLGTYKNRDPIDVILPSTLKEFNCSMWGALFTSIVFPENLESIGYMALSASYDSCLESVTFTGNKLKSIGDYAFARTASLTSITLPEGLEEIGEYAFYQSALKKVKLPSTLTSVGEYAFCETQLEEVELPEGLYSMGHGVFCRTPLKEIKLPDSIREMGHAVFEGTQIKKIVLPRNFEIKNELTDNREVVFEVKKNSKAHKAFLEFARKYSDGYWKLKVK